MSTIYDATDKVVPVDKTLMDALHREKSEFVKSFIYFATKPSPARYGQLRESLECFRGGNSTHSISMIYTRLCEIMFDIYEEIRRHPISLDDGLFGPQWSRARGNLDWLYRYSVDRASICHVCGVDIKQTTFGYCQHTYPSKTNKISEDAKIYNVLSLWDITCDR